MQKIHTYKTSGQSRVNKWQSHLFNSRVYHSLKWLSRTYGIDSGILLPTFRYMAFLDHLSKFKGVEYALQVNKITRLQTTRYLSGVPLKVGPVVHGGVPRCLKGLVPYITTRTELRFVLTVLYVTRRITLPLKPDIESIISPYRGEGLKDFLSYMPGFVKALIKLWCFKHSRHTFKIPFWEEYHLSTKKGPSRHQSLVGSLSDLMNIPENLLSSIKVFGGPSLGDRIDTVRSNAPLLSQLFNQPIDLNRPIRRLAPVKDSEGKTRVVAIGDYWSQTCLKPLHDFLNRVLAVIPQDQTFNQGSGLKDLPFDGEHTYFCFDLTAATDRFPIDILETLLTLLSSEERAKAWYDIMVGYPFEYKPLKGSIINLRYEVGNPMGFYSSWPTFTICHHYVLYVCCRKLKISWFNSKYKLLGDDIVIWDERLAILYRDIMIKTLGVEISDSKTHISKTFMEFAKRYFTPEGEITHFPIKAILEESRSFYSFRVLLSRYSDRGWVPIKDCLGALFDFYSSKPNRYRRKTLAKLFRKIEETNALYERLCGYSGDLRLINTVLVTHRLPTLSCNQSHIAKAIFERSIILAFEKSASGFVGDLQDRCFNALMFATNEELMNGKPNENLVYHHPYSYIVGKYVEETYTSCMNKAYDFDTIYSGEWLPYFRVLKAADATSLMRDRNYAVVSSSAPILLKYSVECCKELQLWP